MKLKTLSAAIALTLCSTAVVANTYQLELNADYATVDNDAGDTDGFILSGEYFFAPVNTAGKPLAEAAFLQKASNVGVTYKDDDGFTTVTADVEFYVPNSMFYVGASFISPEEGDDDFTVTAGVTPVDGWLLTTTYTDSVDYELNLKSKYVAQLAGDTAINFEVGYEDGGDLPDDTVEAGLDYYFNHNVSLGLFTESAAETLTGVRGRYFFNDQFSAEASYATVDDTDTIMLGASVRF